MNECVQDFKGFSILLNGSFARNLGHLWMVSDNDHRFTETVVRHTEAFQTYYYYIPEWMSNIQDNFGNFVDKIHN